MPDTHEPKWRDKGKIGNIMMRLGKHAKGEIVMTTSQIRAAEVYLRKTVPDLSSMTLQGDPEKPVNHNVTVKYAD